MSDVLRNTRWVADGGLETDLVFHHGVDLPEFAAYPLLADEPGRELLRRYYDDYAGIAAGAGAGLSLESPTWRANADWGARLGHDAAALDAVNRQAVDFLHALAQRYRAGGVADVLTVGSVGPRGDGYEVTTSMSVDEAADYHRAQLASFAAAGADLAAAYTLGYVAEARGVVRAARAVGIPVAVSFTLETDGRLPDGTVLAEAIAAVDAGDPPDHFLVNCAHPDHVAAGLDGGDWQRRIRGVRANASTSSHAELDAAEELDEGDPVAFAAAHRALSLPDVRVLGGCCGTDARHVRALWDGEAA